MEQIIHEFLILLIVLSLTGNLCYVFLNGILRKEGDKFKKSQICIMARIMLLLLLTPVVFGIFSWIRMRYEGQVISIGKNGIQEVRIIYGISYRMLAMTIDEVQIASRILFGIWMVGCGVCFFYRMVYGHRVIKTLMHASYKKRDKNIEDIKNRIMMEMSLGGEIEIYHNHLIASPFIYGIRRKKLFLPEIDFLADELQWIFRHEFMHVKRRDILYQYIILFLQAIYWFNPVLCSFSEMYLDISESACDEMVLQGAGKEVRYQYAKLLLRLMEKKTSTYHAVYLAKEKVTNTEERLRSLFRYPMQESRVRDRAWRGICGVICLSMVAVLTLGITCIEGVLVKSLLNKRGSSEMMKIVDEIRECTGIKDDTLSIRDLEVEITPGNNLIGCTLNGKEYGILSKMYLESGSTVRFVIGDSSKESLAKFRIGIMADDGKTFYVESRNGIVSYLFSIEEDGEYCLYIESVEEGRISLSGSVTIL